MTVNKKVLKLHYNRVMRAAKRQFKNGMNWAKKYSDDSEEDNLEMKIMFLNDAKDLAAVALLIKHGKLDAAFKKLEWMDTAARDECPQTTWDFLQHNIGE